MPVVSRMFAILSAVAVAVSLSTPVRAAGPTPSSAEVKTMPVDLSLLVYCDPGDPSPGVDWTDAARRAIDIWNEAVPTIRLAELPPTPSDVSPAGECSRDAPDDSLILRLRHYTTTHGVSSHMYSEGFGRGWVFLENSDFTTYVVDVGAVASWKGTIRALRLDPGEPSVAGGGYDLDWIRTAS